MYISGLSERDVTLFNMKYEEFEMTYYEYGIVKYNISTPREPYKKCFDRVKKYVYIVKST